MKAQKTEAEWYQSEDVKLDQVAAHEAFVEHICSLTISFLTVMVLLESHDPKLGSMRHRETWAWVIAEGRNLFEKCLSPCLKLTKIARMFM